MPNIYFTAGQCFFIPGSPDLEPAPMKRKAEIKLFVLRCQATEPSTLKSFLQRLTFHLALAKLLRGAEFQRLFQV